MNDHTARGTAVVCFALPDESRLFIADLQDCRVVHGHRRHPLPAMTGTLDGRTISVIHTGVGDTTDAREHVSRLLAGAEPPPRMVISAGYAGGLHPDLLVGDLVLGENYSSSPLLEKARAGLVGEPLHIGMLLTEPRAVENAQHKKALHHATGALAVDMETAWIAEACAAAGLPLLSLRAISDAADQDFPVPGGVLYDAVRQRPRYVALPAWLALHPGKIAPFARFVRGLGPARKRLTRALRIVLARL